MLGLVHEVLQALYGGIDAFVFAVGKAVVNKAGVKPRLNVHDQPMLNQSVFIGGRKNFTQFGVCDRKDREPFGLVGAVVNDKHPKFFLTC